MPDVPTRNAASGREKFFGGGWPTGAPIEGWATQSNSLAVRQLAKYVLHLERQAKYAKASEAMSRLRLLLSLMGARR